VSFYEKRKTTPDVGFSVMRNYPALDITWSASSEPEDDEQAGLVVAAVDDERPLAVEPITRGVRVFFSTPASRGRAALRVADAGLPVTCSAVDVSDEDWAKRSQAGLPPIVVGQLMVASPDEETRDFPGHIILIRPSMGFGTGHHASTRLMLRLLQKQEVAGRSVLDVGTGSGVLALAACALGGGPIVAIDVDPDALASARVNGELNQLDPVTFLEADLASAAASLGRTFDLVLANLTGAMIIRHAGELARLAAPDGRLILSGFQDDEAPAVVAALDAAGWTCGDRAGEDGWTALVTTPTTSRVR
jgi:ribosomal protein L11 methyltransferase